ncbi:UNKNOWN [Stylonychia lemnae]|uniref:Uncharacterized protein n=1 Tax=Stylonychia lemnae TaxID=5949 RepID=A0A078ATD5_STYLE|nr:UNKNOWN [Stylonychia lemnae]|eukprot:CDW85271.1 UNKNOWN [Stylonychia lemnae]
MNFVEKKELKNSDERLKLKEANRAYTECISKDFLNRFLAGEKVDANDFCVNERVRMEQLDRQIYGQLNI